MVNVWLYMAQRLSAIVMAPLVVGHLIGMIVAVQGGLTAGEILARTQGSLAWALFYGLFVIAVAVHAPIGLRAIAAEWLGWRSRSLDVAALGLGLALLALGLRAVYAVVA